MKLGRKPVPAQQKILLMLRVDFSMVFINVGILFTVCYAFLYVYWQHFGPAYTYVLALFDLANNKMPEACFAILCILVIPAFCSFLYLPAFYTPSSRRRVKNKYRKIKLFNRMLPAIKGELNGVYHIPFLQVIYLIYSYWHKMFTHCTFLNQSQGLFPRRKDYPYHLPMGIFACYTFGFQLQPYFKRLQKRLY